MNLEQAIRNIKGLDEAAMAAARARQDSLTKPRGSLGRLEDVSIQLAGILGQPVPRPRRKVVILAAGDHGVAAEGVSAYPQEVTGQMVLNFLQGGAGINVLARHAGAEVVIVDAGVASALPDHPALRCVKAGNRATGNIAHGPAMSMKETRRLLETGIALAQEQAALGADIIGTGDMGIANTTPSSAILTVLTGLTPEKAVGRGTGLDRKAWLHKVEIVCRAISINRPDPSNAMDVLGKVGGFEIAVLAGTILGAAASRRMVVLDGFISSAAALIANDLCPAVQPYLLASHQSVEPGHRAMLAHLRLKPLLNLHLRLGEGTGAVLAMHLVEAAARCQAEMSTFGEAGVSEKT